MLGERRPQLRRLLVDVGEDAVEPAVGGDELGGRLLADAGHAREVVARVTAQGGVLRILRRGDARPLEDAGLVVEGIVADPPPVVEHLDVWVLHQLIGVAVAGDDDHVVTAGDGLVGGRGDEVVGLPAGQLARGDAEGGQHLTHQAHLLAQRIGRRVAVGLVRGVGLVAEGRLGTVEGDEHRVRSLLLQHVDEHRREPEHGVGQLSAGRRHVLGQGEEGAVCQGVPVEQQQLRHAPRPPARHHGLSVPAMMRSATWRIFERSLMAVRWM